MFGFIIGLFVGASLGFCLCALFCANGDDDYTEDDE